MTELRLVPELIPEPLWDLSAARLLGRKSKSWRSLRADALADAENRCHACGFWAEGGKYQVCDEVWSYDEGTQVATLVGVRVVCPSCDQARHFGRAQQLGVGGDSVPTLMRVNSISEGEAHELLSAASRDWQHRNALFWTEAVDARLVARWPQLAIVAGQIGEPGRGTDRVGKRDRADASRRRTTGR